MYLITVLIYKNGFNRKSVLCSYFEAYLGFLSETDSNFGALDYNHFQS